MIEFFLVIFLSGGPPNTYLYETAQQACEMQNQARGFLVGALEGTVYEVRVTAHTEIMKVRECRWDAVYGKWLLKEER